MNHYASYVPRNEDISYRVLHDDDGEQPLQRSSSRRYQSKDKRTAELVWIKKNDLSEQDGIDAGTLREIGILRKLSHPHVIKLRNVVVEDRQVAIVLECVTSSLRELILCRKNDFSEQELQSYTAQMLHGLQHCHAQSVVHRNLQPKHLLVTKSGFVKITGFAHARSFVPPLEAALTPPHRLALWYLAPELLLGCSRYGLPVDLWAAGTILAEMAARQPLFPGDSEIDTLLRIFRALGSPSDESGSELRSFPYWNAAFPRWPPLDLSALVPRLSSPGVALLERLLCLDHRRRATCQEALCHRFLSSAVTELFTCENRTVFGAPLVAEPGFSTPSGLVGHLFPSGTPPS